MEDAWFDMGTGKIAIGELAILELRVQAGHMAVNLSELISQEDFPFEKGDFERVDGASITPDDAIELGKLVTSLFAGSDNARKFNSEHLRRLDILGVLPNRSYIQRKFGSITAFREIIGVEGERNSWKYTYDQTPLVDLIEELLQYDKQYGKGLPITRSKIDLFAKMGRTPDYHYFHSRGLRTTELNASLGFNVVSNWDISDYVFFGKEVIEANGMDSITEKTLEILSAKGLGPSRPTVLKHFGTLPVFRRLSIAEYLRASEQISSRREAIQNHFSDVDYGDEKPVDFTAMESVWAKYHVAADCLHSEDHLLKVSLLPTKKFVKTLKSLRPNLTDAHIENIAISLGMFDEIWPMQRVQRSLRVNAYSDSIEDEL